MNRALALAFLLATTLLSGCVESTPGATPDDTGASEETQTIRSLNATVGDAPADNGTVEAAGNATWWALDLDAVTGLRWTIPEDAARTYTYGSYSWEAIPLLATLVTDDVESYGVFLYELDDEARLMYSYISAPMEYESYSLLPGGNDGGLEVDARPLVMFLDDDMAGEEVGIVVASTGLAPGSGFSWSIMDEMPDTWDDVPETTQDYLDSREGPLGTVEATGTGATFLLSERVEYFYGLAGSPGVFGATFGTDDVVVDERAPTWVPPYGGVRDATLSIEHDLEGWSAAFGLASARSTVGSFSFEADLHGDAGEVQAAVADVPFVYTGATTLLTGLPYIYAVGEGSGGSAVSLDIQVATDNEYYVNMLHMVSLDVSMDDLLGVPAVTGTHTYEGLLPTVGGAPVGPFQRALPGA